MQVDPDPDSIWRPSFVVDMPSLIAGFSSSEDGGWGAVLDSSGMLVCYDVMSAAKKWELDISRFGFDSGTYSGTEASVSDDWCILDAGSRSLIVANRTGAGSLACIDADTGSVIWEQPNVRASSICASSDGSEVAVLSIFEGDSLLAGIIDASTGDAVQWADFDDPGFLEWPIFLPSCFDASSETVYLGIGGYVYEVDFNDGTMTGTRLNDHMVQSLDVRQGEVVVASSYRGDEQGKAHPFEVQDLIDSKIEWAQTGTYDNGLLGSRYETQSIDGVPNVVGFARMGDPAVIVTVGDTVTSYAMDDGRVLSTRSFSSTVVGCGVGYLDDAYHMLYVATADGCLDVWMPSVDTDNGRTMRTQLPSEISRATIRWYEGEELIALASSATDPTRLYAYHLDPRMPDETMDVELTVLIDQANDLLEGAGWG